jgi:hypothetical protein
VKKNIAVLLAVGVAAVKAASTNVVTLSTTAVATATGATNAVRKPVVDAGQQTFFQQYGTLLVWVVVIGALFAFMWSKGYLVKIRNFVEETVEELKKCTWPSVDEYGDDSVSVLLST